MSRRNRITGAALLASVLASISACRAKPPEPTPEQIQQARRAAFTLDATIRNDYMSRLEHDEDPVAVYMAYRDNIPRLTKELGEADGFEFSRIASRVRNTTNAADDWEAKKLAMFQIQAEAGIEPSALEAAEIVTEEIGGKKMKVFRWIKGIPMADACMACHGDAIDARLLLMLKQDYPEDEATGYYQYEMRGAYSVRQVLDGKKKPAKKL